MIHLLKFLDQSWEIARGYLREDLDHIEAAINENWGRMFGRSNTIQSVAIDGDATPATRYVANTGKDNLPTWDQVDLTNGVKNRLPLSNLQASLRPSSLLGRDSFLPGNFEEIQLGPGISMQGTVLSATSASGMAGLDGEPGEDAPIIPGPRGLTGLTGQMGPPGLDGEDGLDGFPGPPGPIGATGSSSTGSVGIPGADGEDSDASWPLFNTGSPQIGAAIGESLSLSRTVSYPTAAGAPTAGTLTMVAGTKLVNTTAATSTALIFFQRVTAAGTVGFATTYTVNAGVSFTVSSDSALDTSTFNWHIIETH